MEFYEEGIRRGYDPKEGFSRVSFAGFGFEKFKKGERVPPNVQSAYNLAKILEKYPDFSKEARTQIQNEFVSFPNISVLNLETIAAVLNFLKNYPKPTPNDFQDNIKEYFSRLIPNKSITKEEKEKLIIRLKAQFLKYIIAIISFREGEDYGEEYEEAIEEEKTESKIEEKLEKASSELTKYGEEEYDDDFFESE